MHNNCKQIKFTSHLIIYYFLFFFIKGSPPLTGTGIVRLVVKDMNDHSPEFTRQSYYASVQENMPAGTRVLQPVVTDKDSGLNAKIQYTLLGDKIERFRVNQQTGEIATSVTLDREETSIYYLTLMAQDSSITRPRSSTVNLTITIQDINDNFPTFEAPGFNVNVPDNIQAEEFVYGSKATDADEGDNSKILYTISGKDMDKFTIDARTGVIKTRRALKSESHGFDMVYSIVMHATDQGQEQRMASAELAILLRSSYLFPTFSYLPNTHFILPEDVTEGKSLTKIIATSPKKGAAGNIVFQIAGGNIGEAVRIDPGTGVVSIGKDGLDYELAHHYEIWIEASDSDRPNLRSVTPLHINVTDSNDNPPIIEKLVYNTDIMEEETPPQTVLKVKAHDSDSGDNGEIIYRLTNDYDGTFAIEQDSGEIYTTMKLDREEQATYELTVEAVDQGMPQLTSSALVVVNILDKNDNPPRFTRLFSVNVTENADIGSFVIKVTSSDLDVGENANATYSFTENPGEKFIIDSVSGNVTVAKYLDREQQDEYQLKVAAYDGSWRSETPLTITIQDQNDNYPEFEESNYNFNMLENQRAVSFIGQVVASDKDKHGPNSAISFSLQHPSDLFTIDPTSGEIFSKRSMKYKHSQVILSPENMYSFKVIAMDNGKPPLYSKCLVNINIVNENLHAPKFQKSSYLIPIPAFTVMGQKIVQVVATDEEDLGINSEIEYSVIGGNGTQHFALNRNDGWISLTKPLVVHAGTAFSMMLRAKDLGIPQQMDESTVTVIVTGENEYAPEFTTQSYQVIVPENEPLHSIILTINATDRDSGPNGMVRYSLTDDNYRKDFAVDELTGSVSIIEPLDYDTIQEYHLNITARDLGFNSKATVALLTVILTDINDNAPEFNQSKYHAYIAENRPSNTLIYQVKATDKDSPKNAIVRYSIYGGTDLFYIDSITGEIRSGATFDFEMKSLFVLSIIAENPDSSMSSRAEVHVHVTGVNEYYPQFHQPTFHFDISESADVGTSVGLIYATDKDSGEDGKVYYLLVGSSNDKGFGIHRSSGEIYVSRHLDRETQNRVVLSVLAKNAGSIHGNDTDEAQIIISIQDGNDPPEFINENYHASVSEAVAVGTKVLTVKAVDKDVRAQNNQFSYSIINGNIDKTFKVDPQTGQIETSRKLDRENISSYNLIIGAIDTGLPPQTGSASVKIEVLDVNDNGPTFEDNDKIGFVSENEPAGTTIMKLSASDPDLPPNAGPFTYNLLGGRHQQFVMIDGQTGTVKTTRSIDREQIPELEFVVEVEDNGRPRMSSRHTIRVNIIDQNDSPSSSRAVRILVNAFNNRIPQGKIASVQPNDPDLIGDYHCRIIGNPKSSPLGVFTIPSSCDLHTSQRTSPKDTYIYSVLGNDGQHDDVTSTVTIGFQAFDNTTVSNSITIYVKNVNAKDFLSSYFRQFMELLKETTEKGDEYIIYSVRDVDNSTSTQIGIALRMSNQMYRSPRFIIERMSRKNAALNKLFQFGDRLVVGYSPCSQEDVCSNGGVCHEEIFVDEDENLSIIETQFLIITSPYVSHRSVCKCSDGYTGDNCEKKQDPCSPNPCKAEGLCRRLGHDFQCQCPTHRDGKTCQLEKEDVCLGNPCKNGGSCRESPDGSSFFCLCRPGYRGNQCEHIADSCRPNPCLHDGICISVNPGYKCSCVGGRYGRHCEKTTYGFQELSFMSFPPLDAATNDISIVFATTKPDALLLYNYGVQTGGRSDFVAIELLKGRAYFSFGGARTAITTIVVGGGGGATSNNQLESISNGKWHKITATRNGKVMSLSVSNCTENGDVCKECRPRDSLCYAEDVGPTGYVLFLVFLWMAFGIMVGRTILLSFKTKL